MRDKAIDFMARATKANKPFFASVPITQVHVPTIPNRSYVGKTGNGDWADTLTEMDDNVGAMIDAVKRLGIADNTIIVFTSDNGPESTLPWRGWPGPWRGRYNTALEGGLRVPFIVRWPGHIAPGRVSDEMMHLVDVMPTLAHETGASMPTDRAIDGIDMADFVEGKRAKSGREGFVIFVNERLQAVKWRHWKLHFFRQADMYDPPQNLAAPVIYDLYSDPQEDTDIGLANTWLVRPMFTLLAKFQASLAAEPPITAGALDPYQPPAKSRP